MNCTKIIFLKYATCEENLFKFHYKIMSEKILISEDKQKQIIETLLIEKFKVYKKKEHDLITL